MLLTLLGGCMVTTVGLSNVVWVLLLVNWVFEGRWAEKWRMARGNRLLHAFAVLFFLHVVGLLWTSDIAKGCSDIVEMLPLLAVSLVVLTTPAPEGNTRSLILNLYGGTVFVVTIIGFVRWLTIPDLPHREIVTYIHHTRFALNICMVIYLLGYQSLRTRNLKFKVLHWILILWFLFFLLLLQSYTAVVILAVASLVAILHRRRWLWTACWVVSAGLVGLMIFLGYRSYYRLGPLSSETLQEKTVNGHPYEHRQDGFIENGNYVNNYICRAELINEWPKRSTMPLDSLTASGYSVESALIRYLNALGLTKDSAGVAALTDSQVDEIARGVANPVYEHGSPFRKMLHKALFEYENYRCYRAVTGFSMLQRLELWRCTWNVIAKHPLIGTGTGDLHKALHDEFVASDSPMQENPLYPHNEYLTLIALFGFLGFALIVFFFLRAWHHTRNQAIMQSNKHLSSHFLALLCTPSYSLIKTLWLVTILVSFLTENTLDSLPGILFCSWFLAFFQPSVRTFSDMDKRDTI